ncbi:MAG: YlbF family regulator, partial [Verrucomicrobiia bacterium]
MDTGLESGPVLEKTIELCEAIVSQPAFAALRRGIDAFMENDEAMQLYRDVAEKGQELSFKQQTGAGLSV